MIKYLYLKFLILIVNCLTFISLKLIEHSKSILGVKDGI